MDPSLTHLTDIGHSKTLLCCGCTSDTLQLCGYSWPQHWGQYCHCSHTPHRGEEDHGAQEGPQRSCLYIAHIVVLKTRVSMHQIFKVHIYATINFLVLPIYLPT